MKFRFKLSTQARLALRAGLAIGAMVAAHSASASSADAVKPAVELELTKSEINLSDIVATKGLSRTAIEKFKTIKLSDAPKAGESRIFTSDVIADSIKGDLEAVEAQTGEHFEIKIPSRVTVSKRKPSLSASVLKDQLLTQFKSYCSGCEFEITNLSAPIAAKLPADATWTMRVRGELPKGSFSYPIEVSSNEVVTQTYWVSGQLTVRRQVPVAAHEINQGDRIQAEDLVTQMKDVTFANDVPATAADIASGVSARSIAAGQIVFRSNIRRELAIHNGDIVKVTTASADWEISLDGVAQTSGYVGDEIKVKIPKTGKLVSGSLREKGVVEVQ